MGRRQVLLFPVLGLVAVGTIGVAIAFAIFYQVSFEQQSARLHAILDSQVRLIEAVARFDSQNSSDYPTGSTQATLAQVVDSYSQFKGIGETGEFTLAERRGDEIVFLNGLRHDGQDYAKRVTWYSEQAEPMRRALQGISGMDLALDYRGETVLAAYAPIASLGIGLVAKIDLAEIRTPFIQAAYWVVSITVLLISLTAILLERSVMPLFKRIIEKGEEAAQANRVKSQFLANMSHELRTPLNAVMGFSDMIRQQMLGPVTPVQYQEYANDIHMSGAYLLSLVNDILEMSKIEAGKTVLVKERLEMSSIIDEALRLMKGQAQDAGVTLTCNITGDIPAVDADRRAIKQVLVNLIGNAVKFTPAYGYVTVSLTADESEIYTAVSDTGVGIAPDDMARVMEPFSQAGRDDMITREGTGLGLPLAKGLVEVHGGALALESQLQHGTVVRFSLPYTVSATAV